MKKMQTKWVAALCVLVCALMMLTLASCKKKGGSSSLNLGIITTGDEMPGNITEPAVTEPAVSLPVASESLGVTVTVGAGTVTEPVTDILPSTTK